MSRTPNNEQKLAIEHNGGVILSAGAGSGKTYVLIEHIIYLVNQWSEECLLLEKEFKVTFLQKKFSEIVLMTFTKDAAGELSHRLQLRVEEESQVENGDYWNLVKDNITVMTLTTIHGFCSKLLRQGFFLDFDANTKLLSSLEFQNKIKSLVERWFNVKSEEKLNHKFLELVVANKSNLINSYTKIFSDAKIRYLWANLDISNIYEPDISNVLSQISVLEEFDIALRPLDLSRHPDESKKAWYKHILNYNALVSSNKFSTIDDIESLLNFFSSVRLTTPKKLEDEEINNFFLKLKELREYLKKYKEDIFAYLDDGKEEFVNWSMATYDLFQYIEKEYMNVEGITFADYEYFVLKGLEDSSVAQKISETYKYIIVDEFQDTSKVQFDIISKIISNDFSRLFCVGDVKQAIYGFRGGEIAVFESCKKSMPLKLELNNNYRSCKKIINFNNLFFDHIFKKGLKYIGTDSFAVPVVHQEYPAGIERDEEGSINQISLKVSLDEKEKLTTEDIARVEARLIVDEIKKISKCKPLDSICVLYKNLTPLKFLLKQLIEDKVNFISQVKIKSSEDPYLSIFKIILDYLLLNDLNSTEKTSNQIKGYLELLRFHDVNLAKIENELLIFSRNQKYLGLYFSLENFFFNLGFTNSSYKNNFELIEQICLLAMDDSAKAWLILKNNTSDSYSMKFQIGDSNVTIMTAHGSKGLEFDHVILGGVHTNGRSRPNMDFFGTNPGSFRWKRDQAQSKAFYSPELLLEKSILKRKEFAESKRLFYVANTRAVKSLHYCFIQKKETLELQATDSNCWAKAIELFENNETTTVESDYCYDKSEGGSLDIPFFHMDNLGIIQKENSSTDYLACIPELSVTRLTSLAECPTKFYLKNICKISPEDKWFKKFDLYKNSFDENSIKRHEEETTQELEDNFTNFGASRGTLIHETLSTMIKKNLIIPRNISNKKDINSLNWAKRELEVLNENHMFISEVPIKFPFFGTMISGTPDLIVLPKQNGDCLIVDFKTGKFSPEKNTPYWFQLKIYAFAMYELNQWDKKSPINIELWFVDEGQKYSETIEYKSLRSELLNFWLKIGDLTVKNDQHCKDCNFGNLCHYKDESFAES